MNNKLLIKRLQDIVEISLTRDLSGRINHSDNLLSIVVELERLIKEIANEVNQE